MTRIRDHKRTLERRTMTQELAYLIDRELVIDEVKK